MAPHPLVQAVQRRIHSLYCTVHMRKGPRDASEAERAGGPPRADEPATRVLGLERPHRAHPARAPWPGRRSTWRTAPWCHNPGAGEQYWPTTRQRAGRGRARAAISTWVATSGAVAPPGRRSALPHAAPRTRAPMPKKPVRRHRTQRAKARRVGPRRRRVPAPPLDPEAKERLETSSKLVKPKRNGPILWKQGG